MCAIYGGIAVLTTHKHWQKTTDRVKPITEPLTEWINSMDPHTVETLQKYLLPMSVITGIIVVSTPDVMVEMEFRKLKEQARRGMPLTPPTAPPAASSPSGPMQGPVSTEVSDTGVVTAPPGDL